MQSVQNTLFLVSSFLSRSSKKIGIMLLQLWRTVIKNDYYTLKKVVEVISKCGFSKNWGDIPLLASILSDKTLVLSMDAGREKQFNEYLSFIHTYGKINFINLYMWIERRKSQWQEKGWKGRSSTFDQGKTVGSEESKGKKEWLHLWRSKNGCKVSVFTMWSYQFHGGWVWSHY